MGEVALLGRGRYPATAIVSRDATCLVVPRDAALTMVSDSAAFAALLLERTASRVEGLVARLEAQTLGGVRARLAASLIGLAATAGTDIIEIPSPQAEWAEDLGTVREVLSRELKALSKDGLVERVGRGQLRIRDEDGLEALAMGRSWDPQP